MMRVVEHWLQSHHYHNLKSYCHLISFEPSLERLLKSHQVKLPLLQFGFEYFRSTHDLGLIRSAKTQVQTRVLRISNRRLQAAGVDL